MKVEFPEELPGKALNGRGAPGWSAANDDLWRKKFEAFILETSPAPSIEQLLECVSMMMVSVVLAFHASGVDWSQVMEEEGNPFRPLLAVLEKVGLIERRENGWTRI